MESVQLNTTNLELVLTVEDDGVVYPIDAATLLQLCISEPDGVSSIVVATLFTDGLDGKLKYIIPSLNKEGVWRVQAKVTMPSADYPSTFYSFYVKSNLSCF